MDVVAVVLTAVVALIHVYIVYLEMVLWTTPRTRAAFGTTEAFALESKTLAANQGLYNGFLAAGLICGLVIMQTLPKPFPGELLSVLALNNSPARGRPAHVSWFSSTTGMTQSVLVSSSAKPGIWEMIRARVPRGAPG